MPQPPDYARINSFTQDQLDNPAAPYNGADHDAEFNAVKTSIDGIRNNLGLIQRDDGLLSNGSVHPDSLSLATKLMLGTTWNPRGLWATALSYAKGDVVEEAGATYVAAVAHPSSVFATDRAAGFWLVLNQLSSVSADEVSVTPTGNLSSNSVQSALNEHQDDINGLNAAIDELDSVDTSLQDQIDALENVDDAFADSINAPLRNRIINGGMLVDQYVRGSVTPSSGSGYVLDRWGYTVTQNSKLTFSRQTDNSGAVLATGGHRNRLQAIVAASFSPLGAADVFALTHRIEGFNVADLLWGTSSAKSVTLSFWAYSGATGTYAGSLRDGTVRSYPFTYQITAANTWQYKTVTIAGDTGGTWAGSVTNGIGLMVVFSLGCGSNAVGTADSWQAGNFNHVAGTVSFVGQANATVFAVAGVQLEQGAAASRFERRPFGLELQLCERYYEKSQQYATAPSGSGSLGAEGFRASATSWEYALRFATRKRTAPTVTIYADSSQTAAKIRDTSAGADKSAIASGVGETGCTVEASEAVTSGNMHLFHWVASAEL